jgi:hypothetical protein
MKLRWNPKWILSLVLISPVARADPQPTPVATTEVPGVPSTPSKPERPFLFTMDPSLPAQGEVLLSAGMGNVTRSGEERPIGAGQLIPTLGAEVGVLSHLSLYADAGLAFASSGSNLPSPLTVEGGAHLLITDPTNRTLRLAAQVSYARDFSGASALKASAALAWNYERLRVIGSVNVAHVFREDADPADVGASLGASVQLPLGFRAGAEFVATDAEEVVNLGAEGGPAAFAGPTVGWEWSDRLQIVAGPAFGVGPGSRNASVFGRAAATIRF